MMSEASFASLGPRLLARKGGAKPAMRPQLTPLPENLAEIAALAEEQLEDLGWNDMGTDAPANDAGETVDTPPPLLSSKPQHTASRSSFAFDGDCEPYADAEFDPDLNGDLSDEADEEYDEEEGEYAIIDPLAGAEIVSLDAHRGIGNEKQEDAQAHAEAEDHPFATAPANEDTAKGHTLAHASPVIPNHQKRPERRPESRPERHLVDDEVQDRPVLHQKPARPIADSPSRATRSAAAKASRRAAFTLRLDAQRHLKLRLAATVQGVSAQSLVTEALDALLDEMEDLDALVQRLSADRISRN